MLWRLKPLLVLLFICFFLCFFIMFIPIPFSPVIYFSTRKPSISTARNGHPYPRLAYLVSGSSNDIEMMKRILNAIYHPSNFYLVHLDHPDDSYDEIMDFLGFVDTHPVLSTVHNVDISYHANADYEARPSKIEAMIDSMSKLLNKGGRWDWFVNLDVFSYPLCTQDDLLYVLSLMPRHLNFIDHRTDPSFNPEARRLRMCLSEDLSTGSTFMAVTRSFVEYSIKAWNNLPHTSFSTENYFQTLICNSSEFRHTAVNTSLHFTAYMNNSFHPRFITEADESSILNSIAPFGRMFDHSISHAVLKWIDEFLLLGRFAQYVPGWCRHRSCMEVGDATKLRPSPFWKRLKMYFDKFVRDGTVLTPQCNCQY